MNKRSIIKAVAMTAVISSVLAMSACSSPGTQGGGTSSAPITLTFWNGQTGPDGPAMIQVIDAFNASQSDVQITNVTMPWDQLYQKYLAAASTSDGPQILAIDSGHIAQYAQTGAILPTDDFYTNSANIDVSVLPTASMDATKYQGGSYGVPMDIAPLMVYYNKTMFSAAGVDPAQAFSSWDALAQAAQKLTIMGSGGTPKQYGMALPEHDTVPIYPMLLWGNGGGVVSTDGKTSMLGDQNSIDAMNYWADLVLKHKVSPVGLGGADADALFQSGKAAMDITGPWMTSGFQQAGIDFGVIAPAPGPKAQVTAASVETFAVSAQASDAEKQAAYKFFAFWLRADSQVTWANGSGYPPIRTDVPASQITNPLTAAFGDPALLQSSQVYLGGIPSASSIDSDVFVPTLEKVLNGQGTADSLFPPASQQIQSKLDAG